MSHSNDSGAQFLISIILITVLIFANRGCMEYKCESTGRAMKRETNYEWSTGCMIQTKDGWVPLDRWRVVDDE